MIKSVETSSKKNRLILIFLILLFCAMFIVGCSSEYCAYDVASYDGYAYVSHNKGVKINFLDVNNSFSEISEITTDDMVNGIRVIDHKAYLTGDNALLSIYNVADPLDPVKIVDLNPELSSVKIHLKNQVAFVTTGGGEVYIIDVSDSTQPIILSRFETGRYSRAIDCYGDYLYVGLPDSGVEIYDISDLAYPKKVGLIPSSQGVFDIFIRDEIMMLGCHGAGIRVVDISTPSNPKIMKSFNDGGEAYGVAWVENYILVADLQEGLEIWENILEPELVYKDPFGNKHVPHAISLMGDLVLIADQDRGFEFLNWRDLLN